MNDGPPPKPSSKPTGRTSREAGWRSAGRHSEAHDAMIDDLLRAGRKDAAARVAWDAGRYEDALGWFLELGKHYEAGMCLADTGRRREALDHLMRVPVDHKRYRRACVRVVELATELGAFDFDVDRFVNRFLWSEPTSDTERRTLCTLARVYLQQGFADDAQRVVDRVLVTDPAHADARALLAEVGGGAPPEPTERATSSESLPDLPTLDDFLAGSSPPDRRQTRPSSAPSSAPPPTPAHRLPQTEPTESAPAPARRAREVGAVGRFAPPTPGSVVGGRYHLVEMVGQGGMAVVYRALDRELGQEIALKLMYGGPVGEASVTRFRQELALARQLTHKNIVRVFDIGTHEGSKFISMELLEGRALDEMLDDAVPLQQGVHFMIQACAGLRVAHEHGVVHRDIKPANLFITRGGVVKLMDFGIAKAPGIKGMTARGALVGTPDYMAPEQFFDASAVSATSDLYALGVVMYELFTSRLPFEHDQALALMRMHAEDAPAPLRQHNPHVPESLERVVLRALAKESADRFESATELARALRSVLNELR